MRKVEMWLLAQKYDNSHNYYLILKLILLRLIGKAPYHNL